MTAKRSKATANRPKPDENGLIGEASRLWLLLNERFKFDAGQKSALLSGLKSLDLADRCRDEISRAGLSQTDRWGQIKPNALLVTEVSARGLWLRTASQLGLTLAAPDTTGEQGEDE